MATMDASDNSKSESGIADYKLMDDLKESAPLMSTSSLSSISKSSSSKKSQNSASTSKSSHTSSVQKTPSKSIQHNLSDVSKKDVAKLLRTIQNCLPEPCAYISHPWKTTTWTPLHPYVEFLQDSKLANQLSPAVAAIKQTILERYVTQFSSSTKQYSYMLRFVHTLHEPREETLKWNQLKTAQFILSAQALHRIISSQPQTSLSLYTKFMRSYVASELPHAPLKPTQHRLICFRVKLSDLPFDVNAFTQDWENLFEFFDQNRFTMDSLSVIYDLRASAGPWSLSLMKLIVGLSLLTLFALESICQSDLLTQVIYLLPVSFQAYMCPAVKTPPVKEWSWAHWKSFCQTQLPQIFAQNQSLCCSAVDATQAEWRPDEPYTDDTNIDAFYSASNQHEHSSMSEDNTSRSSEEASGQSDATSR